MSKVSIPSNGSIQFLFELWVPEEQEPEMVSQSPQTGQFNSYRVLSTSLSFNDMCLNPLKRVNSILTNKRQINQSTNHLRLNPLKRVNSILTDLLDFPEKSQSKIPSLIF